MPFNASAYMSQLLAMPDCGGPGAVLPVTTVALDVPDVDEYVELEVADVTDCVLEVFEKVTLIVEVVAFVTFKLGARFTQ